MVVDIHSHILPGIDDGSKKIDMSLDMIRRSFQEGTLDIVATPHFRRGYFDVTYKEVKKIVDHFNSLIQQEGLVGKIHLGQEVYYSERIIEDFEEGIIGTIDKSNYMLVELPMRRIPKEAIDYLYELKLRGITPIIAHPERYSEIITSPERINEFINEGCLFQLNAGSIRGDFGRDVKKCGETLIKHGAYSFIGSDGHNNKNRHTGIKEECEEVFKKNNRLEEVFNVSSRKLLSNEKIFFEGENIRKKRGFFFK